MQNLNCSEVLLPYLCNNIDKLKKFICYTDAVVIAEHLQLNIVFKKYNYYIKHLLKDEKYYNSFSIKNGMFCATFDCTSKNNNYLLYLLRVAEKNKTQGCRNTTLGFLFMFKNFNSERKQ